MKNHHSRTKAEYALIDELVRVIEREDGQQVSFEMRMAVNHAFAAVTALRQGRGAHVVAANLRAVRNHVEQGEAARKEVA